MALGNFFLGSLKSFHSENLISLHVIFIYGKNSVADLTHAMIDDWKTLAPVAKKYIYSGE